MISRVCASMLHIIHLLSVPPDDVGNAMIADLPYRWPCPSEMWQKVDYCLSFSAQATMPWHLRFFVMHKKSRQVQLAIFFTELKRCAVADFTRLHYALHCRASRQQVNGDIVSLWQSFQGISADMSLRSHTACHLGRWKTHPIPAFPRRNDFISLFDHVIG